MGRRIVGCAALAALMLALSACCCPVAGGGRGGHRERRCVRNVDCTACYFSEADRDMGRLRDCPTDDGDCSVCEFRPGWDCDDPRRSH